MKKILSILLILTSLFFVTFAQSPSGKPNINDYYDLLTPEQEKTLQKKIDKIGERYKLDIVFVIVDNLAGKSPMDFADDYYDYGGYGYGDTHDGVLFMISMEERDYWFSTTGKAITYYTDYGLYCIDELSIPYFSRGDYYQGFKSLTKYFEKFAKEAINNKPYDVNHPYIQYRFLLEAMPSTLAGVIAALILKSFLLKKHNDVKNATNADYYKDGKAIFTRKYDDFIRKTKREVYIPPADSDSSSGSSSRSFSGGSTTHTSSSGTSHGGRGGKF